MPKAITKLSPEEPQDLIDEAVDQRLQELLGDPDEGKVVRRQLAATLRRQQKAEAAGEVGRPLDEVARRLELH